MAEKVYFTPKKKSASQAVASISREELYEQLCQLTPSQFNWVIFYLHIPKISLPPPMEPQASRAEAILRFVEQSGGMGIEKLARALRKSLPGAGGQGSTSDLEGSGRGNTRVLLAFVLVMLTLGAVGLGLGSLFFGGEEIRCGDGIVQAGEACDDGNTVEADGCKADCTHPMIADAKKASNNVVLPPSEEATTSPSSSTTPSTGPVAPPQVSASEEAASLRPGLVVFFESGSDVFYPDSFSVLDEVVLALEQNKELRIRIEGHTDSDGSTVRNFGLSKKRADVVKSYIVTRGIDPARLETTGCGVVVPIASNSTEAGRRKNRRVEFIDLASGISSCQSEKE